MTPTAAQEAPGNGAETPTPTPLLQRLAGRMQDYDNRVGAAVALAICVAVFLLASFPLTDVFDLDLREGDEVGGWSQLTLVGFTVAKPFGRSIPDQPGREDLRIISNRPLPAVFDLALDAWWLDAQPDGDLEISVDESTGRMSFGTRPATVRARFENPAGARTIRLHLPPEARLAVRRVALSPVIAGASQ